MMVSYFLNSSFLKLTTAMHKPHGGKSGKREKKFLRQLEKIVILSLRKPLFKKTLSDIYIYFYEIFWFPH